MSGRVARLLKSPPQSVWLLGSIGLNALVSLATIPLFVELLSGEDLATLAQAGGIALVVSTVCSLGANTIGPHIVSGQLGYLKSFDELLGSQVFAAAGLLGVLLVLALFAGLSGTALAVFTLHFGAGVSSAISPNWLMVQRGMAQHILAYHVVGRALYVCVLVYFALVGGGLLLASAGLFAGSIATTWLVFNALRREMDIRWSVRPIRRDMLRQAIAVTSPSLATALFASVAPFVLQAWIGLGAVGLYYVVERARVFVNEVLRAAEAPYYQAIARGGERPARIDAYAMLLVAAMLAAVLPALVAWGPELALIQMLGQLWPYLAVYCLALALSVRAATLYLEGQRAFGGSAALRVAATGVSAVVLGTLCIFGVDSAYAIAIIVGEFALTIAALGYARLKGR